MGRYPSPVRYGVFAQRLDPPANDRAGHYSGDTWWRGRWWCSGADVTPSSITPFPPATAHDRWTGDSSFASQFDDWEASAVALLIRDAVVGTYLEKMSISVREIPVSELCLGRTHGASE